MGNSIHSSPNKDEKENLDDLCDGEIDDLEKDLDLDDISDFNEDELMIPEEDTNLDFNDKMFNTELQKIESQIISQDRINGKSENYNNSHALSDLNADRTLEKEK